MGLLTNGLIHALGSAIYSAVSQVAGWAFSGLTHALLATTSVSFGGWFDGPWRAMAAVAALGAIPIFLLGVAQAVAAGAPGTALRRGLLSPVLIGVGLLSARTLVGGLLLLTDAACAAVVDVGIGGPAGFGRAMATLATTLGVGAGAIANPMPLAASILVAAVVGLLAFVIWVELALRAALLYLLVVFIPLGLAGLFWSWTASWMRRLAEVIAAVALSQLVITVAMVLAGASITASRSGGGIDAVISGVALLFLGTLGLPLALRMVPHATEAAVAAGAGARAVSRVGGVARAGGDTVAAVGTPHARLAGAVMAGRAPAAVGALASMRRAATVPADSVRGGTDG